MNKRQHAAKDEAVGASPTRQHDFVQGDVGLVLGKHGVPRQLPLELFTVLRVDQLHDALVDDVRLKEWTGIPPRRLITSRVFF